MSELTFEIGDKVVYSTHGIGEIVNIESHTIACQDLKVYVISMFNPKISIKVPCHKVKNSCLRHLTDKSKLNEVFNILQSRNPCVIPYKSKSKRFNDYKEKLNSGHLSELGMVVRDLYSEDLSLVSYSQKSLYESALNRLAHELSILKGIEMNEILNSIVGMVKKAKNFG